MALRMKNLLSAFTVLLPLIAQPTLADMKAVEICKANADRELERLNARMRHGYTGAQGERLREKHREAWARRAVGDNRKHEPPRR